MSYIEETLQEVHEKCNAEPEFLQSVTETLRSLQPVIDEHPKYRRYAVLERLTEPDRMIMFRVGWVDEKGVYHVNRGYRVQFNNAIGPYKGGLRFHPSLNLAIVKFLSFEQTFKNALTTLPMGGGKGGSDFDPKGRTDEEVMRFCQSFMTEFARYIGPDMDVPAGDIGVGKREIGYLFGQYKKITSQFNGVITGKDSNWGGSLMRPEATGYGTVYFAEEMLEKHKDSLEGKVCLVSGSGNVAQFTVKKLIQLGAKVVAMSDSGGTVYDKEGINEEKLAFVMDLKNKRRGRISEYADKFAGAEFLEDKSPWAIPCDCAFPCATQNEIELEDAKTLVENGCRLLCEGANMPLAAEAVNLLLEKKVLYGPGKAANAGGVATSGLEMAQNAQHLSWTREEVAHRLHDIMKSIHELVSETAEQYGRPHDYVMGANIAGFVKVADAMIDQGIV